MLNVKITHEREKPPTKERNRDAEQETRTGEHKKKRGTKEATEVEKEHTARQSHKETKRQKDREQERRM